MKNYLKKAIILILNKDSVNIFEALEYFTCASLPDFYGLSSQSGTSNVQTDCFKEKFTKQRKIKVHLTM